MTEPLPKLYSKPPPWHGWQANFIRQAGRAKISVAQSERALRGKTFDTLTQKPSLTIKQALDEFPEECKAVVPWGTLMIPGDWDEMTRRVVLYALEWLAGKTVAEPYWGGPHKDAMWFTFPDDPLRWLLTKVREVMAEEASHFYDFTPRPKADTHG